MSGRKRMGIGLGIMGRVRPVAPLMSLLTTITSVLLLSPIRLRADDAANQLTLADLAAYRQALAGKATADAARSADPPVPASFRDLWGKPEMLRGRRVAVLGRIERIFRQGAVGRFPALVQAWAFSPSGDPFCLVYPAGSGQDSGLGAEVRFTGTFLKIVEYPAGDGSRLAPLIVGDRAPEPLKKGAAARPNGKNPNASTGARPSTDWIVGLLAAVAVVGVLTLRHFRAATSPRRKRAPAEVDPPLEFISSTGHPGETP